MQHGEATLVQYNALDYKLSKLRLKITTLRIGYYNYKFKQTKKLNIINIYALVINNYQMEIGFYNI